jgi:hypothetical protein
VNRRIEMNAQVTMGKTTFTIRGTDHLKVSGGLVEIQRSSPTGYETVAVAGEDLLVSIEPATCAVAGTSEPGEAERTEPADR